jgi:rubrerythrin
MSSSATATRRGLVRGGLAGAAALLALALDGEAARAGTAPLLRGAHGDKQLLLRLLQYERLAELAYSYLGRSAGLSARARATLARFGHQEHRHGALLASALAQRGARTFGPARDVKAADHALAQLGVRGRLEQAHSQETAVRLLIAIETAGEELYYGAVERLTSPALLDLAAEILACEGQHWSGLSDLLHSEQPGITVPHAFVPLVGQFSG